MLDLTIFFTQAIFATCQQFINGTTKKWRQRILRERSQLLQESAPFFSRFLGWFFNDGKSGTYWITLQIHVPVAPLVKLKEQLLFGRSGFYEFFSGGCLGSRWREKRKRHRMFVFTTWGRKGSVNLLPADRIFELRHGDCMKCSHISARNEGFETRFPKHVPWNWCCVGVAILPWFFGASDGSTWTFKIDLITSPFCWGGVEICPNMEQWWW